jgi:hypothetical protein
MKNTILKLSVIFSLFSCQTGEISRIEDNGPAYFPIKEYVEVQATRLDGKTVRKRVVINGEHEDVEITRQKEDWLQELDFFLDADINTNALSQSYETQRSQEYLIHTLKDGENGRIKKIVVQYEGENVRSVSFHAKTENLIYTSETRGVIYTHAETGQLDHYVVENVQEVVFLKPNRLVVNAAVLD